MFLGNKNLQQEGFIGILLLLIISWGAVFAFLMFRKEVAPPILYGSSIALIVILLALLVAREVRGILPTKISTPFLLGLLGMALLNIPAAVWLMGAWEPKHPSLLFAVAGGVHLVVSMWATELYRQKRI